MSSYSIGDVAERCGINPVTLRAWQRRYGLLKPLRSEGGHRQFDEEDIRRIEEIKRWIKSGVPVSKVKVLLEVSENDAQDGWSPLQEEMMTTLRHVRPALLRARIAAMACEHTVDDLLDHILIPVRHRLALDQNTARAMLSLLDGVVIEHAASCLALSRATAGREAFLIAWSCEDRARLWMEAWRLSQKGWHIDVLAESLDLPRPELFPGQSILLWTGKTLSRRQQEQLAHWQGQGFAIGVHEG